MVGVKQGYESIALYKDVLVNVNMSTLNTDMMGSRERGPEAPKKKNGDERDRRRNSTTSSFIQQPQYSLSIGSNHILTEEALPPISDEHQPLLSRIDDESERLLQAEIEVERDLDQLIALKNREELEEVYGIPVIVSCFLFVFLHPQ